ncbi:Cullin family profile domain-containing protein [Entamoeba marina]
MVHSGYVETILNNTYRDCFVRQLQSQISICKRFMSVLSAWRSLGFIDQCDQLKNVFHFIQSYDSPSVLYLSNEFLTSTAKDYQLMASLHPISEPIELQEVYAKETILLQSTLPIMRRNALIYLNKILLSDRVEDFQCISNCLDNKDQLKIIGYLTTNVQRITKETFESKWSTNILEIGNRMVEFAKRFYNWKLVLNSVWNDALEKGISDGLSEIAIIQKQPNIIAFTIAEYCHQLLSTSCTQEQLQMICHIISLINNKDVLIHHYQKLLPQRIIQGQQIHSDLDLFFVKSLTEMIGKALTYPITQIYNESIISNTFTTKIATTLPIPTNIYIFSSISMFSKPLNMKLSGNLGSVWNIIHNSYNSQHAKRKLTLCDVDSLVTCKYNHCKLLLPLVYYCVLEQIQNQSQTISTLSTILCVEVTTIHNIISVLKENNIIIEQDSAFNMNQDLKIKTLNIANKIKQHQQPVAVSKETIEIEQKRFQMLIGLQVQLMKKSKKMSYQELSQRSIEELTKVFPVDIQLVKKAVEYLIEKEYVERDPIDKDTLIYLA